MTLRVFVRRSCDVRGLSAESHVTLGVEVRRSCDIRGLRSGNHVTLRWWLHVCCGNRGLRSGSHMTFTGEPFGTEEMLDSPLPFGYLSLLRASF